jgi:protein SCO1/2
VSVLSLYADKHGADPSLWWFLTGPKDEIYKLARKSYFACLDEGDGGYQDFVHTENVVLVDPQGRLRGFYDGTKESEISQLYQDLERLIEETQKIK